MMLMKYSNEEQQQQQLIILLFLPSLLLSATLILLWWRTSASRLRLPPAPPGSWPILGHLHLLGTLPHQALANLARKHADLDGFLSLRLGSIPAIVASTPHSAKLILQTHDQAFSSRPRTAAALYIGFNSSNIAFNPPSHSWRLMRQLCATDLFSNKRLESFKPIRQEELGVLLCTVFANQGSVMELRPMLLVTSYNIISRMAIGQRLSELPAPDSTNVVDLISEMMHLVGVFNLGDAIPWLRFLDIQGYEKRMKSSGQQWSSILQDLLELRRAANKEMELAEHHGQGERRKDLLDVLLSVSDLTDINIKAVISDMLLGGTDTTAITTEWGLAELVANPPQMSSLQEELDAVVGRTRLVQEEDVKDLPYLQAVVKETMRLHPVGPLLVPHESIEACELLGGQYAIPAKTRVLVNVWAIGRDPEVWDEPSQFEPGRFMPGGGKNHGMGVHGHDFELLPFGSGRRRCPALSLGLISVHITLARLVQAFHWCIPPHQAKVDMSEKFGLTVGMASPLAVTPMPRVDASLYIEQ